MTKPTSISSRRGTAARRAGGGALAHSPSGIPLKGQQGRLIGALGERIVRGVIRAGDLLPRESDLMEEFAVSRTSVREAIKVLSAKGLVETRQAKAPR